MDLLSQNGSSWRTFVHNYIEHQMERLQKLIHCPVCKCLMNAIKYEAHLGTTCSGGRGYRRCFVCLTFDTKLQRFKNFLCSNCGKLFTSQKAFESHLQDYAAEMIRERAVPITSAQNSSTSGRNSRTSDQISNTSGQKSSTSGQNSSTSGQKSSISDQISSTSGHNSSTETQKPMFKNGEDNAINDFYGILLRSKFSSTLKGLKCLRFCPICAAPSWFTSRHLEMHRNEQKTNEIRNILKEIDNFRDHCLRCHYEYLFESFNFTKSLGACASNEIFLCHKSTSPPFKTCSYCRIFKTRLLAWYFRKDLFRFFANGQLSFKCVLPECCKGKTYFGINIMLRHIVYSIPCLALPKEETIKTRLFDTILLICLYMKTESLAKHFPSASHRNCKSCDFVNTNLNRLNTRYCPICGAKEKTSIGVLRHCHLFHQAFIDSDEPFTTEEQSMLQICGVATVEPKSDPKIENQEEEKEESTVVQSRKLADKFLNHRRTVHPPRGCKPIKHVTEPGCSSCADIFKEILQSNSFETTNDDLKCPYCLYVTSNLLASPYSTLLKHIYNAHVMMKSEAKQEPKEITLRIPHISEWDKYFNNAKKKILTIAFIDHLRKPACTASYPPRRIISRECSVCDQFKRTIGAQPNQCCFLCSFQWRDPNEWLLHIATEHAQKDRHLLLSSAEARNRLTKFIDHCHTSHANGYLFHGSDKNLNSLASLKAFHINPPFATCLYCASFRDGRFLKILASLLTIGQGDNLIFACPLEPGCGWRFKEPELLLRHVVFQHNARLTSLSSERREDALLWATSYLKHIAVAHPELALASDTVTWTDAECKKCEIFFTFFESATQECVFCLAPIRQNQLTHILRMHAMETEKVLDLNETLEEKVIAGGGKKEAITSNGTFVLGNQFFDVISSSENVAEMLIFVQE